MFLFCTEELNDAQKRHSTSMRLVQTLSYYADALFFCDVKSLYHIDFV